MVGGIDGKGLKVDGCLRRRRGQKRTTSKIGLIDQWEERVGFLRNFGATSQWEEENGLGIEG